MKKNMLFIYALLLSGCHPHGCHVGTGTYTPRHTVVVEEKAPAHTHVQEVYYICDDTGAEPPFLKAPEQCYYYDYAPMECDWYVGWGCYEVWAWDEYYCEWIYLFDYCP